MGVSRTGNGVGDGVVLVPLEWASPVQTDADVLLEIGVRRLRLVQRFSMTSMLVARPNVCELQGEGPLKFVSHRDDRGSAAPRG